MGYEQFLNTVRDLLQKKLGLEQSLEIHPVQKNNGILLDGVSCHSSSSPLAPTVYLNPYYAQYEHGVMTLSEIVDEVGRALRDNPPPESIRMQDFSDYRLMRPRIMMKLIHREANRKLLADIPFVPYLDLAIVFYLFLERGEKGQMTALIHKEQVDEWGISQPELLQRAMENTPDYYPAQIQDLDSAIRVLSCEDAPGRKASALPPEKDAVPLYVLTNSYGVYGAVCILYRHVLRDFADKLGRDLLIIPSSVHEVILTPCDEGLDLSLINRIILAVNRCEVPAEDRLSNHVYRYNRDKNNILIPV